MKVSETLKADQSAVLTSNSRNYGIDLLRLALMFMVCVLHTLGQGGILDAHQGMHNNVLWLLEISAYCAVDGFALISGYTATNKPRHYAKLGEMWFQVFFYSFVITVVLTAANLNPDWLPKDIIKSALPVTAGIYWYFSAYFALFVVTPVLNKFLFSLDERRIRIALLITIVLFSVVGLPSDAFKTQSGYSAAWLIILYCIGALAKRGRLWENVKSKTLIVLWILNVLITWLVYVFIKIDMLISYVSPTILANGLIMVILFSRIKLKHVKLISKLSPLSFGVYLFQNSPVIWKCLNGLFASVADLPLALSILCVIGCATLIFVCGLLVEFLRSKTAKTIRIPKLCTMIVSVLERIVHQIGAREQEIGQ